MVSLIILMLMYGRYLVHLNLLWLIFLTDVHQLEPTYPVLVLVFLNVLEMVPVIGAPERVHVPSAGVVMIVLRHNAPHHVQDKECVVH
jgi:hypothetical protein